MNHIGYADVIVVKSASFEAVIFAAVTQKAVVATSSLGSEKTISEQVIRITNTESQANEFILSGQT